MPTRLHARLRLGLAGAAALVLAMGLAVPTALAEWTLVNRDVAIRDFAFSPATVRIRVGEQVTWTNRDSVAHSATARNGSFDTGLLDEGESRSIRFTVAGTYRYLCTPHPNMTGTVVVRSVIETVLPPQTDTAAVSDTDNSGSDAWQTGALAAIGGLAFLVARRVIGRRRETD